MVDSIDTFARISLDQWVMLVAVVEEGGVHAGARRVGRTHSAVSSAMGKLQHVLGVELLVTRGRQSVPTDAGRTMARRARPVLALVPVRRPRAVPDQRQLGLGELRGAQRAFGRVPGTSSHAQGQRK